MRSEFETVEADTGNPVAHKACVLPRGEAVIVWSSSGKQKLARLPPALAQIVIDGLTGLLSQFEANRPPCLLLPDSSPVHCVAVWGDIIHSDGHDIASSQLAADREIEQREVAVPSRDLELRPDRPDMARAEGWLGADQLSLVPR